MKLNKLKILIIGYVFLIGCPKEVLAQQDVLAIKQQYQKECSSIPKRDNSEDILFLMGNKKKSLSCYKLGLMYFNGMVGQRDYLKALELFEKASGYEIASAQYMYSVIAFSQKYGYKGSKYKAANLLRESANSGYLLAQFKLAKMTFSGDYFEKDEKTAVQMLENAAENGFAKAQNLLGEIYYKGTKDIKQDKELAVKWFGEAADQGHDKSQYYLAVMFMNGEVLRKDYEMAREWFLASAKQHNYKSQYYLGLLWEKGKGGKQDNLKAIYWYQKAFEQGYFKATKNLAYLGDAKAQYALGLEYLNGNKYIKKSDKLAFDWVRKSANQNFPPAQFELGKMFFQGIGTNSNIENSAKWLKKAANNGVVQAEDYLWKIGNAKIEQEKQQKENQSKKYEQSFIQSNQELYDKAQNKDEKAQYKLGKKYLTRDKKDDAFGKEQAKNWLIKSAENGYVKAINEVAEAYLKGSLGQKDFKEAKWWFEKAAKKGNNFAINRLGYIYEKGVGVKVNNKKAISWYEKGIENKSPESCYRLGMLYLRKAKTNEENKQKQEAIKNKRNAYKWLKTAYDSGVLQVRSFVEKLKQDLGENEIIALDKTIKKIIPKEKIDKNDDMVSRLLERRSLKGDVKKLSDLTFYYVVNVKCKLNGDVFRTPNGYSDELETLENKLGRKAPDIQRQADDIAQRVMCEGKYAKKAKKEIEKRL